jgi:hypothetical protein
LVAQQRVLQTDVEQNHEEAVVALLYTPDIETQR